MRRRYILAAVAVLLIGLGAAWYFLSPAWTIRSMVSAAKSNDVDTLSSYVDFPALKKDLKADLTTRFDAEAAKPNDPTAKIGIAIARSMMDGVINNFVSPGGLRATLAAFDEADAPAGAKKAGKPKIERLGFSRFRLAREGNPGSGFVFERRGLGWKMVGVDLAAEPPRPTPPPPSR
jgi:hypothetical protein